MPLSSNSIIHFTKNKSSLEGILRDNFKIRLCKEKIILGGEPLETHIPMVSFCDIPLSNIKDHIGKYGQYGIGLTKEWAQRKKLNPVLYVEKNSHLSGSLLNSIMNSLKPSLHTKELMENVDVLRYLKNYQADLERESENHHDYRFSDEREWRFVPHYGTDFCNFMLGSKDSISAEQWDDTCGKLDKLVLSFEPNDIKYIIIRSDDEISDFVNLLRNAKGKNYSLHDIERLTTRILTSEQIMTDI